MEALQIILNPLAGRRHATKVMSELAQALSAANVPHIVHQTERPGHAIALARGLVDAGHLRLAAVGGDGTAHEVINGIMASQRGDHLVELACVPAGSGNDFALMNGLSADVQHACETIVFGHSRLIDLGKIVLDGTITRYFDNAVGVGFDGLVCMETRRNTRARGLALYLPAVLKTIFFTLRAPQSKITIDGSTMDAAPLMVTVCNGPREGGGFVLAPDARFDDGELDLVMVGHVNRVQMLMLVPRFLQGTHLSHPAVSKRTMREMTMTSPDPLYTHVDGEVLTEIAHSIEITVVPQCLRLIVPASQSGGTA